MAERDDIHLFVPGPAGAHPEVQAALGAPVVPHYGPEFVADYNLCRRRMQAVFFTENDLYLIVGPGTAALDSAFASAFPDGSRFLVPYNGWFGRRMAEMARAHRGEVDTLEFPLGEPIDAQLVADRLRTGSYDGVAWVHHETSTGVLNPVQPICEAARAAGTLSVIDAVSSLAGTELRVDDWGIDLCVSVSNKGLAAHPGLAALTVSEQAWKAIDGNPDTRSWYLDLRTWRRYDTEWAEWHPYPTTVPSGILAALSKSLEHVLAEGVETTLARTRAAAQRVRAGLRELGFQLFVADEYASPIATSAYAHPELPAAEMITALREQHRIHISGGLEDELRGKIFRVGHMGTALDPAEVELLLAAIAGMLPHGALCEKSADLEGATA